MPRRHLPSNSKETNLITFLSSHSLSPWVLIWIGCNKIHPFTQSRSLGVTTGSLSLALLSTDLTNFLLNSQCIAFPRLSSAFHPLSESTARATRVESCHCFEETQHLIFLLCLENLLTLHVNDPVSSFRLPLLIGPRICSLGVPTWSRARNTRMWGPCSTNSGDDSSGSGLNHFLEECHLWL